MNYTMQFALKKDFIELEPSAQYFGVPFIDTAIKIDSDYALNTETWD